MNRKPPGLDSDHARWIIKRLSGLNVWLIRRTGGRLGSRLPTPSGWVPVGLLNHVGRSSGLPRTTPLIYLRDGERLVVVASQGGRPEHPQWYRNLQATPDVSIQLRGRRHPVRARTASAAEKAALWPRLLELYADYASYQSWTDRDIPVVILEPR